MGQVNYMGGRLNTVKTRNKDTTLQIRRKHFGRQRFKTLSDYLQAINNPVARVVPDADPISKIGLASAQRARLGGGGGGGGGGGVSRREPSSDSSFSGFGKQRYRSYIPAPSKVSSESSDSLNANHEASSTKLSALRILRGLATVEPVSLDYQRKRLLETPDFAGLAALRRRRIEAGQTCGSENLSICGSQPTSIYGSDEDESMLADYGDTISEYSSAIRGNEEIISAESIHSWNEKRRSRKNQLSPSSSIRSFSVSTRHHGMTSPAAPPQRYSDLSPIFPGSDASIGDNDSGYHAAQIYTSDPVIPFSDDRKLQQRSSMMMHDATTLYDPLDIDMSDEWLAFSKMLDTTLYRSQFPFIIKPQVSELDSSDLVRSDLPLGLDFHMFPHLLSERLSQKKDTLTPSFERTRLPALHDEKNSSGAVTEHTTNESENQNMHLDPSPNPYDSAVTSATRHKIKPDNLNAEPDAYALSDIPSILLGSAPPSDAHLDLENSDSAQRPGDGYSNINVNYKRDSRSQWDQLMQELLGPAVPSLHHTKAVQFSETNSNPGSDSSSHIIVGPSEDTNSLQVRSSFGSSRPMKISSSDNSTQGGVIEQPNELQASLVVQNARETKSLANVMGFGTRRSSGSRGSVDEGGSATPGTEPISGPILFAFTFTSDREEDD